MDYVNYISYDNNKSSTSYLWAADDGEWPLEQYFQGGTSCDQLMAPFVGQSSAAVTVTQSRGRWYEAGAAGSPFDSDETGALWYLRMRDNRTGREFIGLLYMKESGGLEGLQAYLTETMETFPTSLVMGIRDLSDLTEREAADYLKQAQGA